MFSVSDKVILFIFVVANVSFGVFAGDFRDDSIDRVTRDRSGLLFAPRLGKRSLRLASENDRQAFYRLLEAADALKYYYEQLPYYESQADEPETKVTKKVVFTPKLGRSIDEQHYENVDFTPRLGRRLANDGVTPADQDVYRPDPDQMDRSKYFSPRLGRSSVNFSPRLGRELAYDYPEKIRVVRSANKTKSS